MFYCFSTFYRANMLSGQRVNMAIQYVITPANGLPCKCVSMHPCYYGHFLPWQCVTVPKCYRFHISPCPRVITHTVLPPLHVIAPPTCSSTRVMCPVSTCYYAHVLLCPRVPMPTCYYAHVLLCPRVTMPTCYYAHVLLCPRVTMPTCYYAHVLLCCRDKAEKRKKQLKAAKILEERERRQFCEERTQRLALTSKEKRRGYIEMSSLHFPIFWRMVGLCGTISRLLFTQRRLLFQCHMSTVILPPHIMHPSSSFMTCTHIEPDNDNLGTFFSLRPVFALLFGSGTFL